MLAFPQMCALAPFNLEAPQKEMRYDPPPKNGLLVDLAAVLVKDPMLLT